MMKSITHIALLCAVVLWSLASREAQAQRWGPTTGRPWVAYETIEQTTPAGREVTSDTALTATTGTFTLAIQPDVPRTVNVVITDDAVSGPLRATVILRGKNQWGVAVTEIYNDVTSDTTRGLGRVAWSSLTSATWAAGAGTAAGDTIALQLGGTFGLTTPLGAYGDAYLIRYRQAGVCGSLTASASTVDARYGTFTPTAATTEGDQWWVWIRSTNADPMFDRRGHVSTAMTSSLLDTLSPNPSTALLWEENLRHMAAIRERLGIRREREPLAFAPGIRPRVRVGPRE